MGLGEKLKSKKKAYQKVFDIEIPEARIVLADLRKLCPSSADRGTNDGKEINKLLIQVGMRKVFEHIQAMLHISDELLMKIIMEENKNQ